MKLLKTLVIILVTFKCTTATLNSDITDVERDEDLENYLREAVENFREQMKVGIPAIKLPVLDPLELRNLDIKVYENLATMDLNIKQLNVRGMSLFNITNLKPNLEEFFLSINLTLPEVSVDGHYKVNGKFLKIFPIYGEGHFFVNATWISIAGKGQLSFTTDTLQMTLLKLDLLWQNMLVLMENFMGGGDFSDVLQRVIPGVGRDIFLVYKPLILDKLETALTNKVNEKLNDPLVKEIIRGILPQQ